jgi:hypothetical protein
METKDGTTHNGIWVYIEILLAWILLRAHLLKTQLEHGPLRQTEPSKLKLNKLEPLNLS